MVIQDFGRSVSRVSRYHAGIGAYFFLVFIGLVLIPSLLAWQWLLGILGAVALLMVILFFEQARARLNEELR